jgi:thiamine-phosphate pyrophosphorylase
MALITPDALRLLAITDRHVIGMGSLVAASHEALAGGLPALMLREKDLPEEDLFPIAEKLREETQRTGALFLVNRRLELARGVGADGVHLGAEGPGIEEARRYLGPDAIIGYSAHGVDEALRAFASSCDYVLLSPIYPTPGKAGIMDAIGLDPLRALARKAPGPVLALGGIGVPHLREVANAGASGAAVVRAIFGARSPKQATEALLAAWDSATNPAEPDA